MKLKNAIIILILALLCAALAGCGIAYAISGGTSAGDGEKTARPAPEPEPVVKTALTPELERKIKEAFASKVNTSPDEVGFGCIGGYNGAYVGFIGENGSIGLCAIGGETVAGYRFVYSCMNIKLEVYKDGSFYSLSGAYKAGILSTEAVGMLYEDYRASVPYLYGQN